MPTYIMLTRVDPSVLDDADSYLALWNEAERRIEAECPDVVWKKDYAVMGPYDYVDIFEAPDNEAAAKVALIIRTLGHAETQVWPAMVWDRFKGLLRDTISAAIRPDAEGGRARIERDEPKNEVTEASEESFPASDPPAWTGSSVTSTE